MSACISEVVAWMRSDGLQLNADTTAEVIRCYFARRQHHSPKAPLVAYPTRSHLLVQSMTSASKSIPVFLCKHNVSNIVYACFRGIHRTAGVLSHHASWHTAIACPIANKWRPEEGVAGRKAISIAKRKLSFISPKNATQHVSGMPPL